MWVLCVRRVSSRSFIFPFIPLKLIVISLRFLFYFFQFPGAPGIAALCELVMCIVCFYLVIWSESYLFMFFSIGFSMLGLFYVPWGWVGCKVRFIQAFWDLGVSVLIELSVCLYIALLSVSGIFYYYDWLLPIIF